MTTSWRDSVPANRLTIRAPLRADQGDLFQPTAFPEVGPAEFSSPSGTLNLLVESRQSMANRLEEVIWDSVKDDLIEPLRGMPYVRLKKRGQPTLSSITEAHRIASPYLLPLLKDQLIAELEWDQKRRLAPHEMVSTLLRRDPNSLIHGVFFATLKPGHLRIPRLLSAFIDARDVSPALSGGVKLDHLDSQAPATEGKGHVPYGRREYVSQHITAAFSLDLIQLERYGLSPTASSFLRNLALYKIRLFLSQGLRLRTACDLELAGPLQTSDSFPEEETLSHQLAQGIAELKRSGEFPETSIWEL